jgi:hypothetical protein
VELQTLANLAEIIGILIVAGGLVFGAIQIVEFRRQRGDLAAIELARIWHEPNFTRAIGVVLDLPTGISAEELVGRGPDAVDAAMIVALNLEAVGLMVHRRIVRLDIVWELMGGMTLSSWERLEGWIRDSRAQQNSEKFGEWIEWLVLQLQTSQAANKPPAHVRYQDWTP